MDRFGNAAAGAQLSRRGYRVVYRHQEVNFCPGCGRTHWLVGRTSAECGFCATALPFATGPYSIPYGDAEAA